MKLAFSRWDNEDTINCFILVTVVVLLLYCGWVSYNTLGATYDVYAKTDRELISLRGIDALNGSFAGGFLCIAGSLDTGVKYIFYTRDTGIIQQRETLGTETLIIETNAQPPTYRITSHRKLFKHSGWVAQSCQDTHTLIVPIGTLVKQMEIK